MELFPVEYGADLVEKYSALIEGSHVVTQPEAWNVVRDRIPDVRPAAVVMANDLSPEALDGLAAELDAGTVVGIGGGTAMDTAKWIHWRRGVDLIQVPSLPSVNACFTRMTALRDGGKVRYEGDAVPNVVLVDYSLIRSAPDWMIRSGIGDVLSCHTALFDWRLAIRHRNDPAWDDEAAGASLRYVDELEAIADEIRLASDEGLRRLMELHREIGGRCHDLGHARFEEGSEHFFAYCFEDVTGRTILHGELVSLGVIVMSTIQGNNPERPRGIIERVGTRHKISELGIDWADLRTTIQRLPVFARDGGYWDSMAQRFTPNDDTIALVGDALRVDTS